MRCLACGSEAVSERPERTAQGYRRFRCRACGKPFSCQATPRFTSYGDGQIYEGHGDTLSRARGPHESARARIGWEACLMIRRGTA